MYGDECLSRTQVWYKRFKERQDKIEDDRHSVQPSMTQEKIKQDRDVILKDCITIHAVAEIVGRDK